VVAGDGVEWAAEAVSDFPAADIPAEAAIRAEEEEGAVIRVAEAVVIPAALHPNRSCFDGKALRPYSRR
jgi:hypothetical protein